MIKFNPLTLVILNILFPVVIFLGKGIIYEIVCTNSFTKKINA